ncbi:MAG: metallophosphoesterase [Akkermansia sp.]|nr:metallophosphoesterase [Akkermansia sp.]
MILYSTIIALLVALYVILRAIKPLCCGRTAKIILSLITLVAAFKFHVFYVIEGKNFFTPELPAWLIWGGCAAFSTVVGYAVLLLAVDIIRIPLYGLLSLIKRMPAAWQEANNALNLSLLLIILGLAVWGTWCGAQPPVVRQITVRVPHMAANAAPIRVVQLTDLHADSTKDAAFYEDIVRRTNELQPDVIVITGDFADGTVETCGAALAPLGKLESAMGTYAVCGNHDYFWSPLEWMQFYNRLGIRFIDGRAAYLSSRGEDGTTKTLQLIGLHDPVAFRGNGRNTKLSELTSGQGDSTLPTILLSHRPAVAKEAAHLGIDLQLSGHTHGGQFPGLQQLVATMNEGFVYGLYRVGNMQLYVSGGTSLWTPGCLRLGVPAEITLITLEPEVSK